MKKEIPESYRFFRDEKGIYLKDLNEYAFSAQDAIESICLLDKCDVIIETITVYEKMGDDYYCNCWFSLDKYKEETREMKPDDIESFSKKKSIEYIDNLYRKCGDTLYYSIFFVTRIHGRLYE